MQINDLINVLISRSPEYVPTFAFTTDSSRLKSDSLYLLPHASSRNSFLRFLLHHPPFPHLYGFDLTGWCAVTPFLCLISREISWNGWSIEVTSFRTSKLMLHKERVTLKGRRVEYFSLSFLERGKYRCWDGQLWMRGERDTIVENRFHVVELEDWRCLPTTSD